MHVGAVVGWAVGWDEAASKQRPGIPARDGPDGLTCPGLPARQPLGGAHDVIHAK